MEGKIDQNGYLWIKRKERFKFQKCFFSTTSKYHCGDCCPLFGEPYHPEKLIFGNGVELDKDITRLNICQGKTLEFTKFTDGRE